MDAVTPPNESQFKDEVVAQSRPDEEGTPFFYTAPWWLVILFLVGCFVVYLILSDETYQNIFNQLRSGVVVTLRVSFLAYTFAIIIGLLLALVRAYPPKKGDNPFKVILYQAATLYVEVLRGLPILVVLLIVAFVVTPRAIGWLNAIGINITVRDVSVEWRAIIALAMAYGAFLSEIFRAGIKSIEKGQVEASLSLGLTYRQTLRYVILPQAVQRVLPPLGNDLIAMIKDSALVAILAVRDITQLAKLSAGQSFLYLETYMLAAVLYLSMTVVGSLVVRWIENKMQTTGH